MKEEIKYNLAEKSVIYLISVFIGLILTMLSLFAAAALCLATDMSENYSTLVAGICLGLGTMLSGFLAGKKIRAAGLINGIICGFLLYAIVFFISLFLSEKGFSVISLSHLLIALISSSIGGVLGVNSLQNKKII